MDHAYIQTVDRLAERWLTWASNLRQEMDDSPEMNKQEAEILFAGLKLIVYSASFQTLPTKRKKEKGNQRGGNANQIRQRTIEAGAMGGGFSATQRVTLPTGAPNFLNRG